MPEIRKKVGDFLTTGFQGQGVLEVGDWICVSFGVGTIKQGSIGGWATCCVIESMPES